MSGVLVDTNILVYAYDVTDPRKRDVCREFLGRLRERGEACVSGQVLGELFVVLTSKVETPLAPQEASEVVAKLVETRDVRKIDYTAAMVAKAADLAAEQKTPFWDTLLAITMLEAGIFTICTENEKDFSRIPGLRVVNPLR